MTVNNSYYRIILHVSAPHLGELRPGYDVIRPLKFMLKFKGYFSLIYRVIERTRAV